MKQLKGMGKIFSFTFFQQIRTKSYRTLTIVLALLCFALPAGIMALAEYFGGTEEAAWTASPVERVFVADESGTPETDFNFLKGFSEAFSGISYENVQGGLETAAEAASQTENSLILFLSSSDESLKLQVLLPENTALTEEDAKGVADFLDENFRAVLLSKSGMSQEQLTGLAAPVHTQILTENEAEGTGSETDGVKEVLSLLLPYLNAMILYFLVLFYGQGVAANVLMEKNSKLMDTFLISVKPAAMAFGKVLALVLSSSVQFLLWAAALLGGFAAGGAVVKAMNPDTDMALVKLMDSIGELGGLLSPERTVIAVVMILAAFLLYCSIAAIGGALASKPEDLSSANTLFTMVLVISFLCAIYAGGITGGENAASWLDWIPFTSVLITPSRILLGEISIAAAFASLGIVLATAAVFLLLSGKIYEMMALYKGNLMSFSKVLGQIVKGAEKK